MDKTGAGGSHKTTTGGAGFTIDAVDDFVQSSTMLQKRLEQKCDDVLTSRRKSAKHFFYLAVGLHITVFS